MTLTTSFQSPFLLSLAPISLGEGLGFSREFFCIVSKNGVFCRGMACHTLYTMSIVELKTSFVQLTRGEGTQKDIPTVTSLARYVPTDRSTPPSSLRSKKGDRHGRSTGRPYTCMILKLTALRNFPLRDGMRVLKGKNDILASISYGITSSPMRRLSRSSEVSTRVFVAGS